MNGNVQWTVGDREEAGSKTWTIGWLRPRFEKSQRSECDPQGCGGVFAYFAVDDQVFGCLECFKRL